MKKAAVVTAIVSCLVICYFTLSWSLRKALTLEPISLCGTNMLRLGTALNIYAFDNNNMFPEPDRWCDLLVSETDITENFFICPVACQKGRCNFAMNINIQEYGAAAPADMVVLFESSPGWNLAGGSELLITENHENKGCNIVFADGHVEFVTTEDLDKLRWTIDSNN